MSIADKSLTIDVWGSITSLSLIQGESNGRKLVYTITDLTFICLSSFLPFWLIAAVFSFDLYP